MYTCQSLKMQDLGRNAVTPTESASQVWEERLRNHAKHSTSVLLVDIYAADRWEGLQLFLEKLITDGHQPDEGLQTTHIYSRYRAFTGTGPGSAAYIKRQLNEEAKRLSTSLGSALPNLEIQVHLFHGDNLPNDRWLRFDDNIVDLGHGLEVLESKRTQAYSFHLSARDNGRQLQEMALQSICKRHRDDEGFSQGPFSLSVCSRDHRRR